MKVKMLEECLGTTVKDWGRVDVENIDCSQLWENQVRLNIDGLWSVIIELPDDLFQVETLELEMRVETVEDGVSRGDMDRKILCLDEESTVALQYVIADNLWGEVVDGMRE